MEWDGFMHDTLEREDGRNGRQDDERRGYKVMRLLGSKTSVLGYSKFKVKFKFNRIRKGRTGDSPTLQVFQISEIPVEEVLQTQWSETNTPLRNVSNFLYKTGRLVSKLGSTPVLSDSMS